MKPDTSTNTAGAYRVGSTGGSAKAPRWLLKRENITQRQWRARKRADLKNLVAAFGRYRMGCAYCPSKDGEVGLIQDALAALTKSHAAKTWK